MQWSYFFVIYRLDTGIALLIQYVAPILVALWRFVFYEAIRRRIWAATLELVASVVAWAWLAETLDWVQLSGAALTLAGIGLAQLAH